MKTKKEHYKKVITWKQKPDYFGIVCCVLFTLVGLLLCLAMLWHYEVKPECSVMIFIFGSMTVFGLKKLGGTLPKGKKIRYIKIGKK